MPLVFVPTPLGNLGDITLRALETLKNADLIVAEDTRVARALLYALKITAKELWSYREQNAATVTGGILERARTQIVAVVSDAGMPGVSDPGSDLVRAARAAGVGVDVLPGPSAAFGVAVLSGFSLRRFSFEGFPPRASAQRRAAFLRAFAGGATTLWYEAPQRIKATLHDLATVAADCDVFLVREYTKKFEQHLHGTPSDVLAKLEDPVRGEISFAVAPVDIAVPEPQINVEIAIDALLDEGHGVGAISKRLAERGYGEKRDLYRQISDRKRARGMGARPAAEDA